MRHITPTCTRLRYFGLFKSINGRYLTQTDTCRPYLLLPSPCQLSIFGPRQSIIIHPVNKRWYGTSIRSQSSAGGKFEELDEEPEIQLSPQTLNLRSSTIFHSTDKLDPSEWLLIYHNREYERSKNLFPALIIGGIICVLFLTFTLILVIPDLSELEFNRTDLLFLGWPIGIGLMAWCITRYRRRFVLRIYQAKTTSGGKRRYCIIWLNWYLRKQKYFYDITQTSKAIERHKAIVNFVGNFKAKRRPWTVKANYFERPQDYFDCRYNDSKVK